MNSPSPSTAQASQQGEGAIKVLLSEKDYADQQITGNFTANARIVGSIFTIVVTVIGWLFASDPPLQTHQTGLILLSLVAIGSIGLVMGFVFNGFAMGFISYKAGFLGPRLAQAAGLPYNPLWATAFINTTPARRLLLFSTTFLVVGQLSLSFGTFIAGAFILWKAVDHDSPLLLFIPLAALMLAGATAGAVYNLVALKHIRETYSGAEGRVV